MIQAHTACFDDEVAQANIGEAADQTLTCAEAAAALGISMVRLRQLKRQKKIVAVRTSYHDVRYLQSDVEALREERARAGFPQIHRPREARPCARADCNRTFKYRNDNPQNFCSTQCRDKWLIGRAIPKNALGRFLREQCLSSGESIAKFSNRIPLKAETLLSLISGRTPTDKTMTKLQQAFGDNLPPTATINARWGELGREQEQKRLAEGAVHPLNTPKARARQATVLRGRKVTPEAAARRRDARKASPVWHQHLEQMTERNRSLQSRALHSLAIRLKKHPMPDDATLESWAQENAERLQVTSAQIRAVWQPTLVKRGLKHAGGRPRKNDRCETFQKLMRDMNWYGHGGAPRRFNVVLGDQIQEDYKAAGMWKSRHLRDCADCAAFARSGLTRQQNPSPEVQQNSLSDEFRHSKSFGGRLARPASAPSEG